MYQRILVFITIYFFFVDLGSIEAEIPLLSQEGQSGVILQIAAQPAILDPVALGRSGHRLVLTLASAAKCRDELREKVGAAKLGGLVTVVEQKDLSTLPMTAWFANIVLIEDPASALKAGLSWKEIARVIGPFGSVYVKGLAPAAVEADLVKAGVRGDFSTLTPRDGWLQIRRIMSQGMGEWTHGQFADGGNREIAPDLVSPRRNAHSQHHYYAPEEDGPGSLEAAREPIWLRWLDGMYDPGYRGPSSGMLVGSRAYVSITGAETFAKIRDGVIVKGTGVMSCRDALNGTLRWARPGGGMKLIAGDKLFTTNGRDMFAIDLETGKNLFSFGIPNMQIVNAQADAQTIVTFFGQSRTQDYQLAAFATADGKLLWKTPLHWTNVLISDGVAVVTGNEKPVVVQHESWRSMATADFLQGFDAKTGKQLWNVNLRPYSASIAKNLMCAGEGVAVLKVSFKTTEKVIGQYKGKTVENIVEKRDETLEVYDVANGKLRFKVPLLPVVAVTRSKEALVCPIPGKLVIVDTNTRWVDLKTGETQIINVKPIRLGVAEWCCGFGRLSAGMYQSLTNPKDFPGPEQMGSMGTSGTCRASPAIAYHSVFSHPQGCGCAAGWGRLHGIPSMGRIEPLPKAEDFQKAGPLEQGPSFARPLLGAAAAEWPMMRGDRQRSAATKQSVSGTGKTLWNVQPAFTATQASFTARYVWRANYLYSTTLTAPVVQNGVVVFAQPMAHAVLALDSANGKTLWRFEADGPIDSAPTLMRGRVVFGCRDGAVYCLDAKDGTLAWRRRLSPVLQRINVYGQLENSFPVIGSVLPDGDGHLWATAGFNGQQRVIAAKIDLATGEVPVYRVLPRQSYPNDLLVTDAKDAIWLNYLGIEPAQDIPITKRMNLENAGRGQDLQKQKNPPAKFREYFPTHLLSPDSEIIACARTTAPNGMMRSGQPDSKTPPASPERIAHTEMVYQGFPAIFWTWDSQQRVGLQPLFRPPTGGDYPWSIHTKEQKKLWPVAKPLALFAVNAEKLDKGQLTEALEWQVELGEIWALAKAGDKILAAGPIYPSTPPESPAQDANSLLPLAAAIGADPQCTTGRLNILSSKDGKILKTVDLPSTPVQDGIAIAGGKIYLTLTNGSIACIE